MYEFIAIHSEKVTRYIPAYADAEIYDYLCSLGLGPVGAAEISSWASLAFVGEIYEVCGIFCEIRSCGDSDI